VLAIASVFVRAEAASGSGGGVASIVRAASSRDRNLQTTLSTHSEPSDYADVGLGALFETRRASICSQRDNATAVSTTKALIRSEQGLVTPAPAPAIVSTPFASVKVQPGTKSSAWGVTRRRCSRLKTESSNGTGTVPIRVHLTVENVDYSKLMDSPAVQQASFKHAVIKGIASAAGVEEETVSVTLSVGSVKVHGKIDASSASEARFISENYLMDVTVLAAAVASQLGEVTGLEQISTGPISVAVVGKPMQEPAEKTQGAVLPTVANVSCTNGSANCTDEILIGQDVKPTEAPPNDTTSSTLVSTAACVLVLGIIIYGGASLLDGGWVAKDKNNNLLEDGGRQAHIRGPEGKGKGKGKGGKSNVPQWTDRSQAKKHRHKHKHKDDRWESEEEAYDDGEWRKDITYNTNQEFPTDGQWDDPDFSKYDQDQQEEQRVAPDGEWYTKSQFVHFFSEEEWKKAPKPDLSEWTNVREQHSHGKQGDDKTDAGGGASAKQSDDKADADKKD